MRPVLLIWLRKKSRDGDILSCTFDRPLKEGQSSESFIGESGWITQILKVLEGTSTMDRNGCSISMISHDLYEPQENISGPEPNDNGNSFLEKLFSSFTILFGYPKKSRLLES